MAKKIDGLSENAFSKAEADVKFDKIGQGSSYSVDIHGPAKQGFRSPRMQSPAQRASVKKAAAASVAKRRAGKIGGF